MKQLEIIELRYISAKHEVIYDAIESIQPKVVIPTHYNMKAFFTKHYGPADDEYFRTRVEELGAKCLLMSRGETQILD